MCASDMTLAHPVVVVVGPTASGKTDVAQQVALALGGEVISADSMQIYTGMDIGTGKISAEERKVAHHGLDVCPPGTAYSAALFQGLARDAFRGIDARGGWSVLAGGTGLYVRAAIDDYRFVAGEQVGNAVRDAWQAFAGEHGAQALWAELARRDERSAELVHPNNVKRVIRALEMLELEGKSYAEQHDGFATMAQFTPAVFFGLQVEPDVLNDRINARVDAMFEAGLVAEVESLLERGFGEALTAREAIGYKEVVAALWGECSMKEASEAIKQATRRYAKRQRTWWRKDARVNWIDANDAQTGRMAQEICTKLEQIERNASAANLT